MDKKDEEYQGIKVTDRRIFNPDGSLRDIVEETPEPPTPPKEPSPPPQAATPQTDDHEDDADIGDIDFPTFMLSLASSVQLNLGLMNHPATQKPEINLPAARQTIDIMRMLVQKTRGNLKSKEEALIKQIVHECQLQFVHISKQMNKTE